MVFVSVFLVSTYVYPLCACAVAAMPNLHAAIVCDSRDMVNHGSRGPLPKSDRNDIIDEYGSAALERAVPHEHFRLRQEPGKDRGVDRILEAKEGGCDTNCRAHLQLKSVERAQPNKDGSISISVRTSNFNYLMNGSCPMYVLYIHERKELRYVYAREEADRLNRANKDWRTRSTVSLRFAQVIDGPSLDSIRARIFRDADITRSVLEKLAVSTTAEQFSGSIDAQGVVFTRSDEVLEYLLSHGISLVASGYPSKVKEMIARLPGIDRERHKILLISAYADIVLCRFDAALPSLRTILLKGSDLSPEDRWFHAQFHAIAEQRLGLISDDQYTNIFQELSNSQPGVLGVITSLEKARYEYLMADAENRPNRAAAIRSLVTDVIQGASPESPLSRSARLVLLDVEGKEINSECVMIFGLSAIQSKFPMKGKKTWDLEQQQIFMRWEGWHRQAIELARHAVNAGHPLHCAEAFAQKAETTAAFLANAQFMVALRWIQRPSWFDKVAVGALDEIERSIHLYDEAQCQLASLKCQLIRAELYEVLGLPAKAHEILTIHAPMARIMNTSLWEAMAAHLAGNSRLQSLLRSGVQVIGDPVTDENLALMGDEDIETLAARVLQATGLPPRCQANVVAENKCTRAAAMERLSHCRYFAVDYHLQHLSDRSTAYQTPPACAFIAVDILGSRSRRMVTGPRQRKLSNGTFAQGARTALRRGRRDCGDAY